MNKKTIQDIDVKGKKVIVRVDFNVPVDDQGKITDETRITAALPTISYLREKGAVVILMSHLGRPKGKVNEKYTMAPVAAKLKELIGPDVLYAKDCIGAEPEGMIETMRPGDVLLLENLRFHKEEEENDAAFAQKLAALAEIYVNDAFGTAHRAHASTAGIAQYLPAVAGFLMQSEIGIMGRALEHPERPFVGILGGAKVSDKIGVIQNLITKVNVLIMGGGMANTFLAAQGKEMGKSLVETDKLDLARSLMKQAQEKGVGLLLPEDLVVGEALAADAKHQVVGVGQVPADWMALDIGPASRAAFGKIVRQAKTIIWNGPMGVFEMEAFAKGTEEIVKAVAEAQAVSIVGGGDSVAAVHKTGLEGKITHISTGGGASLEFLEGKELPGVAALQNK
ncbi:phosphoglycerate kinase [Candidatus Formimonas warabiya]|uniref:Phosphoglycerate kinase n=1 Tax=Formimonas warabiya TaxID=1761012 RepID=A0A3G1KTS4_FORW1|nr:phosphoglycerate kinase [Candidatus Formimonas warabiya]ATW25830.1 phosphoglycerate kinase [Candidatus Formimonas warabiya]